MTSEVGNAPQRAPIDDSSPVVLHARRTVFVMLIVSALVAVGVLTEDVARLSRAVEDAEIVRGLMRLWHAETEDKNGPVSLPAIIAGPRPDEPGSPGKYRLQLVKDDGGEPIESVDCTVHLDLGRRLVVWGRGLVQDLVVEPSTRVKSGGEIHRAWRNFKGERVTGWSPLTRTPNDLEDFSPFWDFLVSANGIAHIETKHLALRIEQGRIIHASEISNQYRIEEVTALFNGNASERGEVHIAQMIEFLDEGSRVPFFLGLFSGVYRAVIEQISKTMWSPLEFDAVAVSPCREAKDEPSARFHVAFPVKLAKLDFDWTKAWIDRAIANGKDRKGFNLSGIHFPSPETKAARPFTEAFSDLHREAEGLESLALEKLPEFLRERRDTDGPTFEVWGASLPSHLMRSLGLFLIVVVQGYAARHISEAASRMETSAEGDPGAFQPWILLYDGLWSRVASFCMVVAPATAAVLVMWLLYEGGSWTPSRLVNGVALILSITFAETSFRNVLRLHAAAQRHRARPQQDFGTASS